MIKKLKKYAPAILSGIFVGTSYIPFPPWAALFCYAPLWYFWIFKAANKKEAFWSGFWTQFIFSLIGFYWIFNVSYDFGGIPLPISVIVVILFACLQHIYLPLLGMLIFLIRQKKWVTKPLPLCFLTASLLTLIEYYYPSLFQWHLGYVTLFAKFPIMNLADIIGFSGIGWIILLVNAGLTHALSLHPNKEKLFSYAVVYLLIFLALNFIGSYHGQKWNKLPTSTVQFLPIQANIGNLERLYAERGKGYQDFIADTFIQMSSEALQKTPEAQIFIWPESAFPDVLDQEVLARQTPPPRVQKVFQFLKNTKRFVITGAYSRELVHPEKGLSPDDKMFNALFILGPDNKPVAPPYRKRQLLAFGEYTPFSDIFPELKNISPAGAGFERGPGPTVLTLPLADNKSVRLGPQICYEALDPAYSQKAVQRGAQILVNITNDSWFGPHSEPYEHLYMTLARAIENRRPLIRVTNTGITTAIEANGKILAMSPLFTKWTGNYTLHYNKNPQLTTFTKYGQYLPLIIFFFILVIFGFGGKLNSTHTKNK